MAKTKQDKKELLEKYKEQIANSKGIVIVKAQGVTPSQASEFRKELFDYGAEFHVIKNTLFKLALKESQLEEVDSLNMGSHSVVILKEDIVSPAKALKKFIEDTKVAKEEIVEVVSGFLDGNKLSQEQAKELAEMPTKEESISMIMGILDNAVAGIVNVLEDAPRSYVTILEQAFKE